MTANDCKYDFLASDAALSAFLQAFEEGTWPKSAWNHAAHLAVGTCYLLAYSEHEATDRIRRGIRHYNECAGIVNSDHSGYHETLTKFWLHVLKSRLRQIPPDQARVTVVKSLIEELAARRDVFREYYSFDVVRSTEARRNWIPPDVKPLP